MRKPVRALKFVLKYLWRAIPFLLIAAIVLALVFFPKDKEKETEKIAVVRVWNVDTFEGGKGSRTNFLRKVAAIVERDRNVYYMIDSYTAEGALAALAEGNLPDLLSFGVGLSDFLPYALSLPYSFSGGESGSACLAYPWCSGRYSLFSLDGNFEEEGATAISDGGENLSELAAYYGGVAGETIASTEAYVGFLNGKYRYLFGTQRDECRFASRGVDVARKELSEYCDLFQYISMLSAEKYEDCMRFVETLVSDEVQNTLSSIGMFPIGESSAQKTVGVFSDAQTLASLLDCVHAKEDIKNIDKTLKTI